MMPPGFINTMTLALAFDAGDTARRAVANFSTSRPVRISRARQGDSASRAIVDDACWMPAPGALPSRHAERRDDARRQHVS